MKKMTAILFALTLSLSVACAGGDRPIQLEQLPAVAKQFIQAHFATAKVAIVKESKEWMDKDFEVVFTNGDKIEFDKKGAWTEVECNQGQVPVAIIPQQISAHVATTYPNVWITSIEQSPKGYKVDLSNKLDLKFNEKFALMKIDD
ncbi:MAG: PepSY-like domain-containing protein [Alistipes sp.]